MKNQWIKIGGVAHVSSMFTGRVPFILVLQFSNNYKETCRERVIHRVSNGPWTLWSSSRMGK